jgi:predicted phosphate transport protein (TIGR00153 family)
MGGVIAKILPREERFFDLFERQAEVLVSTADALARLLSGKAVAHSLDEIKRLESAADEITREVLTAVRRSFITPFDRGAIASLSSAMDDAVDEMWHAAKAVRIYGLTQFEPQMSALAELAREAARLVREALPLMRNVARHSARLHEIAERIRQLESRADELHEQGLMALFAHREVGEPLGFFVGHEVYRYIERVLDRLQDVADEIHGIVIDHA